MKKQKYYQPYKLSIESDNIIIDMASHTHIVSHNDDDDDHSQGNTMK